MRFFYAQIVPRPEAEFTVFLLTSPRATGPQYLPRPAMVLLDLINLFMVRAAARVFDWASNTDVEVSPSSPAVIEKIP